MFGAWLTSDCTPEPFQTAQPFGHLLIDDFLAPEVAQALSTDYFPADGEGWWRYHNPIEVKLAKDRNLGPLVTALFRELGSECVLAKLRQMTGIADLQADEFLHGAGLHMHPRNGRLMMHLDYEQHPLLPHMERRLNLILYLSQDWDPAWRGATELWNADMTECVVKSEVAFNRALLFQTNAISWHGVPDHIRCPPGTVRKSLAFYYLSPLTSRPDADKPGANAKGYRTKACFVQRPGEPPEPRLQALLDIRPHRRITPDDMAAHWPDWSPNF